MSGRGEALVDELLAGGPAIEASAWSLARPGLALVCDLVAAGRQTIVECGSGLSTIVLARLLARIGKGELHAIEHDADWAALGRRRLAAERLGGVASVIEAPLRNDPIADPGCRWYDPRSLDALPRGIDLLLVDGPPASPEAGLGGSRYPALPRLADRLAPGAAIVLDDADRAGERRVLERWRSEHGIALRPTPAGVAVGDWRPRVVGDAPARYVAR